VLIVDNDGHVVFVERDRHFESGEWDTQRIEFDLTLAADGTEASS
jgi:hypothetical protein